MVCWCLFCDRFWGATRSFTVVVVGGGYQYDSSVIGCSMSCFQFGTGEDYTFIFGACDYHSTFDDRYSMFCCGVLPI